MYDATARRANGYAIWTGVGGGSPRERDTLMCKHCQAHWFVEPGSGRRRGWCARCAGPTCGAPRCEARCEPFEQRLEQYERQAAFAKAAGLVER